ncbi:hypothetical protein DFJ63DRAFT_314714 [Scheffersomyces coipomensis]|uniref:uncharacterized protein n=1 Tax=Scheffersomyces coipomensis TaxID=1788519 RepID=UPI00315D1583
MKLSSSAAIAILAYSAAINAAPTVTVEKVINNDVIVKRNAIALANPSPVAVQNIDLDKLLADLKDFKVKRDDITEELSKRQYQIVTDVLAAINQSELAPTILNYFVTDSVLQPIVIETIILVIKSGVINLTALFNALDESNLVANVVQDLISDCSLYVSLFNTAKGVISDLATIVKQKIAAGISSLSLKRELATPYTTDLLNLKRDIADQDSLSELEKRAISINVNNIVVNLLESLYSSGLATSVIESVLTDANYIPFAVKLISALIATNSINLSAIVSALESSDLAPDLLKQILTVNTFNTVIANSFAAYAGTCSASTSGGSSSSGSGSSSGSVSSSGSGSGSGDSAVVSSGSGSGSVAPANPCSKKRRRRKRSNY